MTQTMLNFFNSSSGKLIIFVEGAGFEPAKWICSSSLSALPLNHLTLSAFHTNNAMNFIASTIPPSFQYLYYKNTMQFIYMQIN